MLHTAGYLLSRDSANMIFLDGRSFSRRYQIENVLAVAAALDQPWRILECICPGGMVRQRLQSDNHKGMHPAENRDYELYLDVKARFETITFPKTVIDTGQELVICVELALAALKPESFSNGKKLS